MNLNVELGKKLCLPSYNGNGKRCRNRKRRLSESKIMTILICYHFGTYRNFKEYYQNYIRGWLKNDFSASVSYNRFVRNHASCILQDDAFHEALCLW